MTREITRRALKLDNGDLPCNVSAIESQHKKMGGSDRQGGGIRPAGGGVTGGPRGTTFWGQSEDEEGLERGWCGGAAQSLASHGRAMAVEKGVV